jgi:GT2 family glycosyltransferase
MGKLVRDNKAKPERDFVKHRLAGFKGEILRFPHTSKSPGLTVIIPTRDAYGKGYFPILLEQLQRQTAWKKTELIVIKGDNRQGRAINAGAALARGEYILTMDDDEVLGNDCVLERLLTAMKENPDIGMAGGMNIIPRDAPPFVKRVMREIPRRSTPPVDVITDSDMAEHGLLIMRKEVFKEVGGENELMPRGLDPYLREQFRRAGYRIVVVPGAVYSHMPPATLSKLVKQFYHNGRQAAFVNRNYPQWVIETPAAHGRFKARMPLPLRILRFPVRLLAALMTAKPIWFLCSAAYALGFAQEFLFIRESQQ